MDWLMGILLVFVGVLIGYFVAKFVNQRKLPTNEDVTTERTLKELMAQQAASHVQESKQLVQQLMQQAEALQQQIDNYEQLIINLDTKENGTSMNYFGEHTAAYLRNNTSKQNSEKTTTDFQPLDFASKGSGLFSGSEEKKAK